MKSREQLLKRITIKLGGQFNPFTAPACNISGLKDAQCVFRSYDTSTFNAVSFDENPFASQCEKENKMLKGFKFRNFISLVFVFLSDIMAVKGLKKK